MKRPLIEHAWEAQPAHRWEGGASHSDAHTDESDDDGPSTPDECVDEFIAYLMALYMQGAISAQAFCVIVFWSSGFHNSPTLQNYGMKPGSSSGHYQRHLSNILGFKEYWSSTGRLQQWCLNLVV